jgi:hypothetical protein
MLRMLRMLRILRMLRRLGPLRPPGMWPVVPPPPLVSRALRAPLIVLVASGASDQGMWGVYGCVFSLEAMSDFGGRRYRRFVLFNFLLAASHLHGVLGLVMRLADLQTK